MAVFVNSTNYIIQFFGYRADGKQFNQWAPDIYPNNARYINQDNFGDTDWYIVLAYEQGATIEPGVGVTTGSAGGGGTIGVVVPEVGGITIGVSGSAGTVYSRSLAAVQTGPHDLWQVVENSDRAWGFIGGGNYSDSTLSGW